MKSTFRNFLRETKGIAAIEVAFIMPVMFLLYFGLFDLTSLISVNRKVTYAASVVADLVAQNKTSVLKSRYPELLQCLRHGYGSDTCLPRFAWRYLATEISGSTISQVWKTDNARAALAARRPLLVPWLPSWLQETIWLSPAFAQPTHLMPQISLDYQILGERDGSWRNHYTTATKHP